MLAKTTISVRSNTVEINCLHKTNIITVSGIIKYKLSVKGFVLPSFSSPQITEKLISYICKLEMNCLKRLLSFCSEQFQGKNVKAMRTVEELQTRRA
jgi:hypothetical protein